MTEEGAIKRPITSEALFITKGDAPMTTWTSDELDKIGRAEELQIASVRRDGTLRQSSRTPVSCAREETPESRGMPCLFLNTERGFGGKPPQKSGFRRHLAGSKMPKEGSKTPKETFFHGD